MTPLGWGRRYLMCPPDHFEVAYSINPWMTGEPVDPELAQQQWATLVSALRMAGAEVETITPVPGLPDMVFTANAGLVSGGTFVAGRMRHPERAAEIDRVTEWFAAHGFATRTLEPGTTHEGLGDAIPIAGALVVGHGVRSSASAAAELHALTGAEVVQVGLHDPRWYHVDLTLCPLDDRRALVYPDAYDPAGARAVLARIPEPIVLTGEEAATFAANSVVIGSTVVMPHCPPRIGRALERAGLDVVVCDVSEFVKAGGAVRCLTLATDTVFGSDDMTEGRAA